MLVRVRIRIDGGADLAALLVVFGGIHADETGPLHALGRIVDLDAAEFVRGGENLVVHLDLDNVLVFDNGPVRAVRAVLDASDRGFPPQPIEIRLPGVLVVNARIAGIEIFQRRGIGERLQINIDWCVHSRPLACFFGH